MVHNDTLDDCPDHNMTRMNSASLRSIVYDGDNESTIMMTDIKHLVYALRQI